MLCNSVLFLFVLFLSAVTCHQGDPHNGDEEVCSSDGPFHVSTVHESAVPPTLTAEVEWVTDRELPAKLKDTHNMTLVLFYSSGCVFCEPMLDILKYMPLKFPNISAIAAKCKIFGLTNVGYGVVAFPTLVLAQNEDVKSRYNGSADFDAVVKWISKESGTPPLGLPDGMAPVIRPVTSYMHPDEWPFVLLSGLITLVAVARLCQRLLHCCRSPRRQAGDSGED